MDSQKNENLLNLALDSSETEREKSGILNVGYDISTQEWELIIRYHGDSDALNMKLTDIVNELKNNGLVSADVEFRAEYLYGGYAVLTVPQVMVDTLSGIEEIEYIEKPKRLYFSAWQGKQASCIFSCRRESSMESCKEKI